MKEIQLPVTELLAGLAEECCELAQAALKLRRFYDQTNPTPIDEVKATEDFYEELADVSLYLDQIHFPISYVVEIKKAKLNRWKERLGKDVSE